MEKEKDMIKITQTGGMELKINFSTIKEARFLYDNVVPLIEDYNNHTRQEVLQELAEWKNKQ